MAFKLCPLCSITENPLIDDVKAAVYATVNYYLTINISCEIHKDPREVRLLGKDSSCIVF